MASGKDLHRLIESDLRSLAGKLGKRRAETSHDNLPSFLRERFSSWKSGVERALTQLREHGDDTRQSSSIIVDLVGNVLVQSVHSLESWRKNDGSTLLALGILHRLASQLALSPSRLPDVVAMLAYFVASVQKLVIGIDARPVKSSDVNAAAAGETTSALPTRAQATDSSNVIRSLQASIYERSSAASSTAALSVAIQETDRVSVERQLLRILQILFEIPSFLAEPHEYATMDAESDTAKHATGSFATAYACLPQRLFTLLVLIEHVPGVSPAVTRTADAALERLCTALFEDCYWRKHVAVGLIEDLCLLLLERPPAHGFGNASVFYSVYREDSTHSEGSKLPPSKPHAELSSKGTDNDEEDLSCVSRAMATSSPREASEPEQTPIQRVTPSPWILMTLLAESLSNGIRWGLEPHPELILGLFPLVEALLVDTEPPWPVFALASALLRTPLTEFAAAVESLLAIMLKRLESWIDPSLSTAQETRMSFAMSHYALMLIETFRDALTADNQIQPDIHEEGWSTRAFIEHMEDLPRSTDMATSEPSTELGTTRLECQRQDGVLTRWVSTLQVGLTTSISLVDDLSRLPSGPLRNVRPCLRQLGRQIEGTTNESTEVEMASDLSSATLGLLLALLEGVTSNASGFLERTWPDLLTAFGAVLARGHMLPAATLIPLIERGINGLLDRLRFLESNANAGSLIPSRTVPNDGGARVVDERPPAGLTPYETVFICLCRTLRLVGSMQVQTDSKTDANNAIPSLLRYLERNLELALQAYAPESGVHPEGDAKPPIMAWNPNTWLALVESILALDEKTYKSAGERLISIAVRHSIQYDTGEATGEHMGKRTEVSTVCLLEALLTVAQAERENASLRDHAFQYAVRVVTAYLRATEARALKSCLDITEALSSHSTGNEENGTTSERDSQLLPPLVSWMTPIGTRLWERFEQFVPVMAAVDYQAVLEAWSQLFKGIFSLDSEPELITAGTLQRCAVRPLPQARLFAPLTSLIQEANSRLDQEFQEGVPSGPHPVRLFCDLIQLLRSVTQDHGELLTSDGWTVVLSVTKQATLAGITIQTATAKSDRRAIQEAGFTLLQLLANEYAAILMHMSSDSPCRALWIETLSAWALHAEDVNMALSSIGMLWSICDLLDPAERNDVPLWLQIFATLAQIGQVDRAEVRNSALKTFLGALLAHGEHLSVDRHWKGIWEEALLPLAACLLADPGKFSAWKRTSPFSAATDSVERVATAPVEEDLTVPQVPESAAKQWNASRLLLLEGLVRLIHRFLASRWLDLEPLPSYWQTLLTHWERTVWLSEDDDGVPSNHTNLLLALIALWQAMLETLAGLLFHREITDVEREHGRRDRAEQLWRETWRRARNRDALAYRWPRFAVPIVQKLIEALVSLRSRVVDTNNAETHRIVQALCLSCLEVLSEQSAAVETSSGPQTIASQHTRPRDLNTAVREAFMVLAQWPGDAAAVRNVAHIQALLTFLERIRERAINQAATAASRTDQELTVDVCIAQGLLERLARSMPPNDASEPEQRDVLCSMMKLIATYLLGGKNVRDTRTDKPVDRGAVQHSASASNQHHLTVGMKSSSVPSSLVECAVYSLVAIVDALDEDDQSAALLDNSLYALLHEICERFLFDGVSPLPEQVAVNVGQLNMIHTGQLEEEKCSIAIIQLAARLGMVDLIVEALGLKPPPASADATWFVASTTAYRFNLRLAATEALFALAAQHPQDKIAPDERRTGRLATRHDAATAARATARLLTAHVDALYASYRRRSGLCPLPYLMRMYAEYILSQAGQFTKQEDTPASQVVADLSDFRTHQSREADHTSALPNHF